MLDTKSKLIRHWPAFVLRSDTRGRVYDTLMAKASPICRLYALRVWQRTGDRDAHRAFRSLAGI